MFLFLTKKLRICDWDPLISKVERKLALWMGSCLSYAGRLCLIKSVLSSMPVHLMSLFKIRACVSNKLERYMKKFLWKGRIDGRGLHKVGWDTICQLLF